MGQRNYSVDEYFAVEEMSELRYEFVAGAIIAMPGGTLVHNRIEMNLTRAFDALRPDCEAFAIAVRIKIPESFYTYPDVMLIRGRAALSGDRMETVTNPTVIAEVLSEETRDYDRGQKFDMYRAIPSMRDVLFVDQYTTDVEHRFLAGAQWNSTRYSNREDVIRLTGVETMLRVSAIYDDVDFSPPRHDH